MSEHRNKYVIQVQTGHPGYHETTIHASHADLISLADEIKRSLVDGYKPPYVASHYATLAHGSSSRVMLHFQEASEARIDALHVRKDFIRAKIAPWFIIFGGLGFMLVGIHTVWGWVMSLWH